MKHTWTVVIGIVEIIVSISLYDHAYDTFDTIILSLLILIYITLRTASAGFAQALVSLGLGIDADLRNIRTLINSDIENEEDYQASRKEALEEQEKSQQKFLINMTVLSIIYIIVVFHLLGSLYE